MCRNRGANENRATIRATVTGLWTSFCLWRAIAVWSGPSGRLGRWWSSWFYWTGFTGKFFSPTMNESETKPNRPFNSPAKSLTVKGVRVSNRTKEKKRTRRPVDPHTGGPLLGTWECSFRWCFHLFREEPWRRRGAPRGRIKAKKKAPKGSGWGWETTPAAAFPPHGAPESGVNLKNLIVTRRRDYLL